MADDKPRPVGRLRAAWHVLMGQRVTPAQQMAEWLEYKLIFDDILTRLGAQLARQSKAHKDSLKRNIDASLAPEAPIHATSPELAHAAHKAELRQRAAAARGLSMPMRHVAGAITPAVEESP